EDEESMTFAELASRSGQLAHGLRRSIDGDSEEDAAPIALLAPTSPEAIVAALAVLRAGRRIVPIDTQLPDDDLAGILDDCQPGIVLTSKRLAKRLKRLDCESELPDCYALDDESDEAESWECLFGDENTEVSKLDPEPDSIAVIFYTSGTTGRPKGVPLSHRNLCFQLEAVVRSGLIEGEERILLPLPLHHVYPFVIGLLAPLALGQPVVLPEGFIGSSLARALREGKPSVTIGVPRLYQAFYQALRDRLGQVPGGERCFDGVLSLSAFVGRCGLPLGRWIFGPLRRKAAPDLRLLASGGSPLDPDLARKLTTLGWEVAIGYGLTETSPLLTLKLPGKGPLESVGRAIEGVELKTDPEALPEGESGDSGRGELLAKGPNVFSGYHGREDDEDEIFTGDGFYRTGDIARIDEADYVFIEGRISTRIALQGGENVDPEDLEEAYTEVEDVEEIGILEDEGKLAALVVPTDESVSEHGSDGAKERIRDALERRGESLASYQRLARVEFSSRSLDRTRLGKLRRRELESAYQSARSGGADGEKETAEPLEPGEWSTEDRALLDEEVARKLWDLLCKRYPNEPLAPDAHLEMDLGIDSMEWVELSVRIESELGQRVDEELIGRVSRVRDLLEAISEGEATPVEEEAGAPLEDPVSVLDEKDRSLVAPRGPVRHVVTFGAYCIMRFWLRCTLRFQTHGQERIPEPPFLLVPNHVSYLDAPCLSLSVPRKQAERFFWAGGINIMFANPFMRALSRLAQVVPVDARRSPRRSLAFVSHLLDEGHPLVWFPEGRVSEDGDLQPFQPGVGVLLKQRDVPVVPVYLKGTRKALPPGKKWPRRARIKVRFGEPCRVGDLVDDAEEADAKEIAKALQDRVAGLADAGENSNDE
ncbi:MAG TPA: AMP-binding protein, partial [Opitutales bacterium]|nr:AMP-binding protein [Opitutales bacterium]